MRIESVRTMIESPILMKGGTATVPERVLTHIQMSHVAHINES